MADLATSVHVEATGSPTAPLSPAAPETGNDRRDFAMVPLERIRLHPLNLRRELRDLDELADSIRQNGLVEPVVLVPDPEPPGDGPRFLLVAGHRRHAACVIAKHDPVEAIIRQDLGSAGAQVLAMLTENGPRDDLTPIEEAHGYQLAMDLNQLTPAKLAKRLGKPRARIDHRITLTRLPEPIQDKVHAHQISLTEADAMVEFAKDAEALEDLQRAVGKPSFQYRLGGAAPAPATPAAEGRSPSSARAGRRPGHRAAPRLPLAQRREADLPLHRSRRRKGPGRGRGPLLSGGARGRLHLPRRVHRRVRQRAQVRVHQPRRGRPPGQPRRGRAPERPPPDASGGDAARWDRGRRRGR